MGLDLDEVVWNARALEAQLNAVEFSAEKLRAFARLANLSQADLDFDRWIDEGRILVRHFLFEAERRKGWERRR